MFTAQDFLNPRGIGDEVATCEAAEWLCHDEMHAHEASNGQAMIDAVFNTRLPNSIDGSVLERIVAYSTP